MSDQFLLLNLLFPRSFFAQIVFSLRSVVRWQMHGILRDGPTHVPGRGSPAARWSLELAEKVSNYLNICRIDKSSRLPRMALSFVRCERSFGKMPDRNPKSAPFTRSESHRSSKPRIRSQRANCTSGCKSLRSIRVRMPLRSSNSCTTSAEHVRCPRRLWHRDCTSPVESCPGLALPHLSHSPKALLACN